MLPIYLLTDTYILKGKPNPFKRFIIFTSNGRTEAMLTVSDRWWELLCPFGRKEPDERQSRDRKNERF